VFDLTFSGLIPEIGFVFLLHFKNGPKNAIGIEEHACAQLERKPLSCFEIHAFIKILTPISAAFLASVFE